MTVIVVGKGSISPGVMEIGDYATAGTGTPGEIDLVPPGGSDIPGFPLPEDVLPTEFSSRRYVGYRIEKQKYDAKTGEWIPLSDYYTDDLYQSLMYYTQISYNQFYRYRAYSIMRVIKDSPIKSTEAYAELVARVIELAPEAADILGIYGTVYNAYWIESYPSPWKYIKIVDKRRPKPVEDLQVFPKSNVPTIMCTWIKPVNEQKDIVKWRVFRRLYGEISWSLVFEGSLRENIFEDMNVVENQRYVYAVQGVDIHGLKSRLSAQWVAQINKNFDAELEEKSLELYQGKGEDIERNEDGEYDPTSVVVVRDGISKELVAYKYVIIQPVTTYPISERDFLLRITSLDTGEKQDVKLQMRTDVIPPLEIAAGKDRPVVQAKDLSEGIVHATPLGE